MTFADFTTEGYEKYLERFPQGLKIDGWEDLPWQLDIRATRMPFALERCVELGEYLGKCADEGQEADFRGYVDAIFLYDGMYEKGSVLEKDFDKFVELVSQEDYLT